ncbi:MAG: pyridoxal-phosphate dependent enzyme [Thermoproteus sp.]
MEARLRCPRCGYRAKSGSRCPACGFPLVLEPPGRLKIEVREPSMWRYSSAIGVAKGVSLGEGMTPMRSVGGVLVKDESRNPTGSFMDRGSAVLASAYPGDRAALPFMEDFTVSIATYLSAKGVSVEAHVDPAEATYADFILLAASPSVSIRFGRAGPFDLEYGDPYFLAGVKTIAYEIFESARRIDSVAVPLERGLLALAVHQGFRELEEWGLMEAPRLILATHRGAVSSDIALWLREKGARIEEVEPAEAAKAAVYLARRGIYAKPLSAMAYVAASSEKNAVAVVTGTGLRRLGFTGRRRGGELQRRILGVLSGREMTAYQMWEALGGAASLRGVYKALATLVARGSVTYRYKARGRKKIRVFSAPKGIDKNE